MSEKRFSRGNDRIDRLVNDPEFADEIRAVRAQTEMADRAYGAHLAAIRKAADKTQLELARNMGVGQDVISRMEKRHDIYLSTLDRYLRAVGASSVTIVADIDGQRVELDLSRLEPDLLAEA